MLRETLLNCHVRAKRDVGTGVVHIVALDSFVHDSETAPQNGLASTADIIGETDARSEISPIVLNQTGGNSVLAGDANPVQIE